LLSCATERVFAERTPVAIAKTIFFKEELIFFTPFKIEQASTFLFDACGKN
jgi:hypothetical protein